MINSDGLCTSYLYYMISSRAIIYIIRKHLMSAFQSKFDHGNLFISELKTVDFNSFLFFSYFYLFSYFRT